MRRVHLVIDEVQSLRLYRMHGGENGSPFRIGNPEMFDLDGLIRELYEIAGHVYDHAPNGISTCDMIETGQRLHTLAVNIDIATQGVVNA